ncbi:MAG: Glucose-6-phosphate 1-dehydrogenase [Verrucomicrobia subdivision 3 bacterium]|nr:Glucose-6-phosphate 1-dehydrogenase [Limisphaerales bacterium]MCS1412639.1 Glucose-6-phosphate 1-dehydrogenase [Limisphaerales bacterium]
MEELNQLDEILSCRSGGERRDVAPCTIVIFGASGDLTSRKLVPALYHLFLGKQLPEPCRIVGVARREKTDESWRAELRAALVEFARSGPVDAAEWERFEKLISYCQGDLMDSAAYQSLRERLKDFEDAQLSKNLLFYLAIFPSQFSEVVKRLHGQGLVQKESQEQHWQRVVIEKPFGHDLDSAQRLNREITGYLHEKQVFRIDHYLGKETVQNILAFRFSNAIFENLWTRDSVDHVQITVSEKLGVGSRGGYYEESGALRDMVQNHLLQVLSLVAMEPPVSLDAEAIRDEKVKLLRSIRPLAAEDMAKQVIRGQYFGGRVDGQQRPAYRGEDRVDPASNVETYVAMQVWIDNWRWSGVPFYLRTGKNLPLSASEVRVQFRPIPNVLFAANPDAAVDANSIVLRLQPNESICLGFNGKFPGSSSRLGRVLMDFRYDTGFGAYTPEAYERLLLEAMAGDSTLFIRRDEVETSWAFVDGIRAAWGEQPLSNREFYAAGTWGPEAADALLSQCNHRWINPQELKHD